MNSSWLHGTSGVHEDSIRKRGLLSRGESTGTWNLYYHQPSLSDSVYVTSNWYRAAYYAARTALHFPGSDGLIVTVRGLSPAHCYPDESVLLPPNEFVTKEDVAQFQETILQSSMTWQECHDRCGMIRYRGMIDSDQCVSYQRIRQEENPWKFLCMGTVEDFDWATSLFEAVFRHYHAVGFHTPHLHEYRIVQCNEYTWSITIPKHPTIKVVRERLQEEVLCR